MKKTTIFLLLSILLSGVLFTSCTEEPTPLVTVECTNATVTYPKNSSVGILYTTIPANGIMLPRGTELRFRSFNSHLPSSVKIYINGKLEIDRNDVSTDNSTYIF